MVACTRIADESILERGLIASPDIVVVADETPLEDAQAGPLQGLAAAGRVLMNFKSPPVALLSAMALPLDWPSSMAPSWRSLASDPWLG
jgi:hypothetical protein